LRPIQKPKIFNAFMKNRIEIKKVKIRNVEIIQYIINGHLRNYAENLEKIEPKTLDWIDNFEKNSVFYDVGALSGPFSIYAALKTGVKVVAFEPEAQNFAALEMNHYLNRKRITHPIISLNIALSNLNELGKLYMSRNDAGSTVKILDKPVIRMNEDIFEPGHIQYVLKNRLDDLIESYNLPLPDYIKIDVDGSEEGVLKGAKKTLSRKKVKSILIELLKPDGKSSHLVDDLQNLDFILESKEQVEDYVGLYNCIFKKESK